MRWIPSLPAQNGAAYSVAISGHRYVRFSGDTDAFKVSQRAIESGKPVICVYPSSAYAGSQLQDFVCTERGRNLVGEILQRPCLYNRAGLVLGGATSAATVSSFVLPFLLRRLRSEAENIAIASLGGGPLSIPIYLAKQAAESRAALDDAKALFDFAACLFGGATTLALVEAEIVGYSNKILTFNGARYSLFR